MSIASFKASGLKCVIGVYIIAHVNSIWYQSVCESPGHRIAHVVVHGGASHASIFGDKNVASMPPELQPCTL